MNDYLSRAAQRASDVSAGVRPALPSAFDSDRGLVAPADGEAENSVPVERSRNPAAADQTVSVRERIAALEGLWTEPAQPPVQTREAEAKQTSIAVTGTPVVVPATTNPAASQPVVPKNETVTAQGNNTFSAHGPAVTPFAAPTEPAREDSPPPVIGKPISPPPAPVQASPSLGPRPLFPGKKAGPTFRTDRNPISADHDATSPAGAIHVTIGRVEVRAIHPPAELTPRRPAPKPTLSLDDYLKQRNRGARE